MRKAFIYINIILLIVSATFVGRYLYNSYDSKKVYQEMSSIYYNTPDNMYSSKASQTQSDKKLLYFKDINEDIVGWINIPGTNIDYPVVQGRDNDFYLTHNAKGQPSIHGAIFMDFRNRPKHDNLIIYGHRMRDGTMFEALKNYQSEDFFQKNSDLYLLLDGKELRFEVFSAYVTEANTDYLLTSFPNKEDFLTYLNTIKNKSKFSTNIEFTGEEKLLTLSTCSYNFSNARMVVHAYLIHQ